MALVLSIDFAVAIDAQASGPAVAYSFNEGIGETTADLSGNGNTGLLQGLAWTTDGFVGKAVSNDDGGTRYLEVPASATLALTTAFTFEGWVNAPAWHGQPLWKQWYGSGGSSYGLLASDPVTSYVVTSDGTFQASSTSALPVNAWTHVATTYDGAALRIYVNGTEVATTPATGTVIASSQPTLFGIWQALTLDDVRIYRRALSAAELFLDMATPVDPATPFRVTAMMPAPGALAVMATPITAAFDRAADASTVTTSTVQLRDPATAVVAATVSYDAGTRRATLTPASALTALTDYTVRVAGGTNGVKDLDGNSLAADVVWSFRTAAPITTAAAAYSFNEGIGETTADLSGNGNTGLLQGLAWTPDGYIGKAVSNDDGGTRYLEVPASPTLTFTTGFTVEAWVNAPSWNGQSLWQQWYGANGGSSYGLFSSGPLRSYVITSDGTFQASSLATLPVNAWTHVATTYDGTTLRIYVNGGEAASTPATGTVIASPQSTFLGIWQSLRMDDVRIYRRALSAEELALDMATPVDPATPFRVTAQTPAANALAVMATPITAAFGRAADASTLTSSTVQLRDPATAVVAATMSYDAGTRRATLTPASALTALTDYTVRVAGGTNGVKDLDGNSLAADVVWSFRTAAPITTAAAAYNFSEGTGETTADLSGNGNTALLQGLAWATDGYAGNAVRNADGGTRYLEVPTTPTLTLTTGFTFEAWVNASAWNGQPLWQQWYGANGGSSYGLLASDPVTAYVITSDGAFSAAATGPLPVSAWTHVATTYDGTTLRIFVNSSEVASTPATGTVVPSPQPAFFGIWQSLTLDDVRIYRRALSMTELTTDMATPVGVVVPPATPTVSIQLTSPFGGTTFNSPSSIAVGATTSVTNGSISRVDFFAGSALIGSASSSAYQITWSAPAVGIYALKAVALDNAGGTTTSLPVNITVSNSGSGLGTLAAPLATPTGGLVGPNQVVTLAAASGAAIRYTTDGSTPTESSPLYTSPLSLTGSATITARAFQGEWTSSDVTQEAYQVDAVPPTITAAVSPVPNGAGWSNTTTTVSFTCADDLSGVSGCPAPVTFDLDGASQSVTVTALDAVGNQGTTTVTVNIDKTAPAVVVTSPSGSGTTTDESVVVQGQFSDTSSGIRSASCNGQSIEVVNGTGQCTVAMNTGRNTVVLGAIDVAGNGVSTGLVIARVAATPTTILITPGTQQLALGETRAMTAATESGVAPDGLTWTSSDPSVVSVESDGGAILTAQGAGQATITANAGGLSATASVTVVGLGIVEGTARWSVAPVTGLLMGSPISGHRVDDNGPDLFTVESINGGADSDGTIRALRADGTQLWTMSTASKPLFGDSSGGLITLDSGQGWYASVGTGIVRVPGSASQQPWRYDITAEPAGWGYIFAVAQGSDSVLLEETSPTTLATVPYSGSPTYNMAGALVGLDEKTGVEKFRRSLPASTFDGTGGTCSAGRPIAQYNYHISGEHSETFDAAGSIVSLDGATYLQVRESHDTWAPECHIFDPRPCWECDPDPHEVQDVGQGTIDSVTELKVLRIPANGAIQSTTLWRRSTRACQEFRVWGIT